MLSLWSDFLNGFLSLADISIINSSPPIHSPRRTADMRMMSLFREAHIPQSLCNLCLRVIKGRTITNRTVNNDWARGGPVTNETADAAGVTESSWNWRRRDERHIVNEVETIDRSLIETTHPALNCDNSSRLVRQDNAGRLRLSCFNADPSYVVYY